MPKWNSAHPFDKTKCNGNSLEYKGETLSHGEGQWSLSSIVPIISSFIFDSETIQRRQFSRTMAVCVCFVWIDFQSFSLATLLPPLISLLWSTYLDWIAKTSAKSVPFMWLCRVMPLSSIGIIVFGLLSHRVWCAARALRCSERYKSEISCTSIATIPYQVAEPSDPPIPSLIAENCRNDRKCELFIRSITPSRILSISTRISMRIFADNATSLNSGADNCLL